MVYNKDDVISVLYEVLYKLETARKVESDIRNVLDIEEECNEKLNSEWLEECFDEDLSSLLEEKLKKIGDNKNGFWNCFREFFDNWDNMSIGEKISGIEELDSFDKDRKKDLSMHHKEKKKNEKKCIKQERNNKVIALSESGKEKSEIADEIGISVKTVERILRGINNEC